ncbi:MAG: hypothetical protein ACR65T_12855 [Methylocystis sp.]|uniref:hypothetical protein n=1 Tax=Methylocystis sp. TaxID=1911079 RepID=UPI003DA4D108
MTILADQVAPLRAPPRQRKPKQKEETSRRRDNAYLQGEERNRVDADLDDDVPF